jgi:tripeptidyl-peptidase-1
MGYEQQFMQTDTRRFQGNHSLSFNPIVPRGLPPYNPDLCKADFKNCFEGSLDTQYIFSVNSKARTTFWSFPIDPFFSPFWRLVSELNADPDPPDVHSISYANSERYMNPNEARKFNDEVCKLALRGITIIVASGDTGAHGIEGCYAPPVGVDFKDNCTIAPLFPASCPYVTVVGATMGPECDGPEIAATVDNKSRITSGGGFSNIFDRPAWQNKVVRNYLLHHRQYLDSFKFNQYGRAYPDVSLLGNKYRFWIDAVKYTGSGTSAAAPVFASLISLANSIRFSNGKPKLGFLNPLLYSSVLADSFRDITVGNNRCCLSSQWCCESGFDTAVGWDPVTGLGSLDFKTFLSAIADYPSISNGESED